MPAATALNPSASGTLTNCSTSSPKSRSVAAPRNSPLATVALALAGSRSHGHQVAAAARLVLVTRALCGRYGSGRHGLRVGTPGAGDAECDQPHEQQHERDRQVGVGDHDADRGSRHP